MTESDEPRSSTRRLGRLWNWLTEPAPSIEEPGQRRQARLLAALLVSFIAVTVPVIVALDLLMPYRSVLQNPLILLAASLDVLFVVAYGLNRAGHYTPAAVLTVSFSDIGAFATAIIGFFGGTPYRSDDVSILVYIIVPVLFGSMLLSIQALTTIVALNMVGVLILPVFFPQITFSDVIIGPLSFILAVSTLVVLATQHRSRLERDRQADLAEKEERYRSLLETTFEGTAIYERGRLIEANSGFAQMFGYTLPKVAGMRMLDFVAEGSRDLIARIAEVGPERPYEALGIRKDGTTFHVELVAKAHTYRGRAVQVFAIRDITERKQAEEEARRHTAQLEALRQVGLELAAQLELDTLLHSIVSRAMELLEGDSGGLYFYRPERDVLEWMVTTGSRMAPAGIILHRGEGLSGKVWETGEPLVVDDYGRWAGRADTWEDYPVSAVVGVPVRWGDEFLRVLNVEASAPRTFSPADADLLTLFATDAATAIQNARLFEMERRRTFQLTAVAQVAERITSILSLDELLHETVELIVQTFGHYHAFIMLLDAEAGELVLKVDTGGYTGRTPAGYRQKVKKGMAGWAVHLGETLLTNDVTQESRYIPTYPETRSELAVPLKYHDNVIGVLDLQSEELNTFSQHDVMAMETLAGHIAAAIENALLYEQAQHEIAERKQAEEALQRRNLELALLHHSGQAFNSTLDLDQVLTTVLEEIRHLLDVTACSIWLLDPATDELICWQASGPQSEIVRGWRLAPGIGLASWVVRHGETLIVADAQSNGRYFQDVGQEAELELRSILSLPLQVKQDIIGVLQVVDTEVGRFDKSDLALLEPLTAAAAVAIENARLYEQAQQEITERKRAEKELRESEKQLRQQERLAAVGQLASGIAHDFNNLMATIILSAQMSLYQDDLPPDVVQGLEIILEESYQAAKLVQQILDFSRRSMMETRPVNLAFFSKKVIDILQRTITENIHLTLDTQSAEPEEYMIKADPTRIQQVLMNLTLNARDAMPEGGELRAGLSRVTLKPGEKPPVADMSPGEWVCLTVSDTGMGMTEDVQAHLFEPFFTTKEPGKGTGLGLAQVHGIVKQHEGHIGVETAVGEGTTFRIYLPAYEEGEKVAEVETKKPSAHPQGKGETILLVEDSERLRRATRGVLESLGYQVLTAAHGEEALEVYRSADEVDLVIADLVMPGMGGRQLLQALVEETPDLKALAITGYVMEADSQELKKAGFLDVIYKPFDADRLAKVVRHALDAG